MCSMSEVFSGYVGHSGLLVVHVIMYIECRNLAVTIIDIYTVISIRILLCNNTNCLCNKILAGHTHTQTDRQTDTHTHTDRQGENNTSQSPPGAR